MVSVGKWGEETGAPVLPMHLAVAKTVSPSAPPLGHILKSVGGERQGSGKGVRGEGGIRKGLCWGSCSENRETCWVGEFRVSEVEKLEEAGARKREAGEVRHEGGHGSQHRCCTHLLSLQLTNWSLLPRLGGKEAAPAATSLSTPSGALPYPEGPFWARERAWQVWGLVGKDSKALKAGG